MVPGALFFDAGGYVVLILWLAALHLLGWHAERNQTLRSNGSMCIKTTCTVHLKKGWHMCTHIPKINPRYITDDGDDDDHRSRPEPRGIYSRTERGVYGPLQGVD